jgi:hypothetical protein
MGAHPVTRGDLGAARSGGARDREPLPAARLARLPAFRNVLIVRGLLVAFVFRFMMAYMKEPLLAPSSHALLLAASTLAVLLDVARRREDLFLGNLGIGHGEIAGWALVGAVVSDVIVTLMLSALLRSPP